MEPGQPEREPPATSEGEASSGASSASAQPFTEGESERRAASPQRRERGERRDRQQIVGTERRATRVSLLVKSEASSSSRQISAEVEQVAPASPDAVDAGEVIGAFGFGGYQVLVGFIGGGFFFAEGADLLAVSSVGASLQEDWQLSSNQQAILVSLTYVGLAIGSIISGVLSDTFGRRVVISLGYTGLAAFALQASLSWDIGSVCLARLLSGVACGIGVPGTVSLVAEATPPAHRAMMQNIVSVLWGTLGELYCCAGLYLFIPDLKGEKDPRGWRPMVCWIVPVALLMVVLTNALLDESPRWLAVQGRLGELSEVLSRMARLNGRTSVEDVPQQARAFVAEIGGTSDRPASHSNLMALLNIRMIRYLFLVVPAFVASNMALFGMSYVWPMLLTDDKNGIGSALQPPAVELALIRSFGLVNLLFLIPLVNSAVPHRMCLLCLGVFGGVSFLLLTVTRGLTSVLCGGAGLILSSSFYFVVITLAADVFPTQIRSLALGVCFMLGRIGAILSPFLAQKVGAKFFPALVGGALLKATLMVQGIPETKGLVLEDYVDTGDGTARGRGLSEDLLRGRGGGAAAGPGKRVVE